MLANYGIPTQTPKQIEPVTLSSPGEVLLNVSHVTMMSLLYKYRYILRYTVIWEQTKNLA